MLWTPKIYLNRIKNIFTFLSQRIYIFATFECDSTMALARPNAKWNTHNSLIQQHSAIFEAHIKINPLNRSTDGIRINPDKGIKTRNSLSIYKQQQLVKKAVPSYIYLLDRVSVSLHSLSLSAAIAIHCVRDDTDLGFRGK